MTKPGDQIPPSKVEEGPRRNFLVKAAAIAVGGLITVVPAVVGTVFFLNPLRKKSGAAAGVPADGFVKVGTLGSLVPGGSPQLFQVTGIKRDAWTTYPQTELGAVYVRLLEDGSPQGKPSCFNASCPHLGCAVNYQAEQQKYVCPCHDSAFTLDGERSNEIPPRNMDSLEVEIRNEKEVWVKFQNYQAGTEKRIPV